MFNEDGALIQQNSSPYKKRQKPENSPPCEDFRVHAKLPPPWHSDFKSESLLFRALNPWNSVMSYCVHKFSIKCSVLFSSREKIPLKRTIFSMKGDGKLDSQMENVEDTQ